MAFEIFVQENDPGAVGFGNEWRVPTTGNMYIRNTSNTSWTLIGNANSAYIGNAPTTTFTTSGAITGPTGWAPIASPDFINSCKLNGVNVATVNDLATMRKSINSSIDALISEEISVYTSGYSTGAMIASVCGTLEVDAYDDPFVLPDVIYATDGIIATTANSTISVLVTSSAGDQITVFRNVEDTEDVVPGVNGVNTFIAYYLQDAIKNKVKVRYLILAVRK